MSDQASTVNPFPRLFVSLFFLLLWTAFFVFVVFPLLGWGSAGSHWARRHEPAYRAFLARQWPAVAGVAILYLTPLLSGLWLFWRCIPIRTYRFQVVRGLVYRRDPRLARQAARQLSRTAKPHPQGLFIHPALRLPSLEKGVFLCGARGSGKTQVILRLLMQLLAKPPRQKRERRLVLFDEAGDYTELLPRDDFILLAPWHQDGHWWDLSADLTSLSQARRFTAQFIAEPRGGENPMWAKGARQVLAGILNYLIQHREPIPFNRLLELFTLPDKRLLDVLRQGNPEAVRTLGELVDETRFNRTGQSFIANLSAHMAPVTDLAFAWQSSQLKPSQRFSIRDFLADDWDGPEVLVIQGSKAYGDLARALAASVISLLVNQLCSPGFPQVTSRGHDYNLYFFLDEVAQLGRVPELEDLISLGRKKGVRPILGLQDIAKIVEIYGPHLAKVWASQFGAYYFGQVGLGDTAHWVAQQVIGTQEIEYLSASVTLSAGGTTDSLSLQRREQPVVLPSQLASELGVTRDKKRFRGLMFISGTETLLRLEWPIVQYPVLRPAVVPNEDLDHSDFSRLAAYAGRPGIARSVSVNPAGMGSRNPAQGQAG